MADNEIGKIIKLTGDSSFKQIYREYHYTDEYPCETSIIIDFSRIKTISDEYFHVTNLFETSQYELYREINNYLYKRIPHSIGCRVPEIYNTCDHEKTLEIEDLGDESLLNHGYKFKIYLNLIKWLAHLDKLHKSKDAPYFIKDRQYEVNAICDELNDFFNCFGEEIECTYMIESTLEKIKRVPTSICHRDFQPRNIMIHNGEPRIIDVQDMCWGPVTYDLACLLYDPKVVLYEDEICALMRIYSFLTDRPYDDIKKWTRLCGKIRLMKSAGRHAKIYHETDNDEHKERAELAVTHLLEI